MKKRSVKVSGHPTSISLEDEFWTLLQQIAKEQKRSLDSLMTDIDGKRAENRNLSSAVRIFVLNYLHAKTVEKKV